MIPTILIIICIIACVISILFTANRIKKLKKEQCYHEKQIAQLKDDKLTIIAEMSAACDKRRQAEVETNMLQQSAEQLRKQADDSAQAYYEEKMNTVKLQLEKDLTVEQEKFQQAKEAYAIDYETAMADMAKEAAKYGQTAKQLAAFIEDMQSKANAAMEAQKRKMEEHNSIEFHRIQIPDSDLLEIEKLREIIPYLRDKEALNKVIYKIYYENPTNDLIGRVVGKKQSGIYKITNINNGMCYVGQAVNFANRWKQHIKRGVGAEPITHNKLYPAMQKEGVENFTFEIIEECPSSKLNDREQYWQKYFGAKEFGYSIR